MNLVTLNTKTLYAEHKHSNIKDIAAHKNTISMTCRNHSCIAWVDF